MFIKLNFIKSFFCKNANSLFAIEFRLYFLSIIERY